MEAITLVKALAPHGPADVLRELRYHYVTRRIQLARPWLARRLPRWLIQDAVIRAGVTSIRDDEVVPDALFMTVLERWSKAS
jgi:hypothetical protein